MFSPTPKLLTLILAEDYQLIFSNQLRLVVIPIVTVVLASIILPTIEPKEFKPIGDYRKDVKRFVQRSKAKECPADKASSIVDLCLLHQQIVADPRFETNDQLRSFRAVVAGRLKKCQREMEVEIKRARRRKKPDVQRTKVESLVLKEQDFEVERQMIASMKLATAISGGPVRIWNYTGGNFAGPLCDYGPDLVLLIENTISPDSWRNNGGNAVIEYYQPLRILVVGASSQMHEQITDLLNSLR